MPYRSPLETRIAKKTTQAISDFHMLEEGDRVLVGLSGGKDSWALMQILDVLRRRAKMKTCRVYDCNFSFYHNLFLLFCL